MNCYSYHMNNKTTMTIIIVMTWRRWRWGACAPLAAAARARISARTPVVPVRPVPITIFSLTTSFPMVGLPRNRCLIGCLTAAQRFSKVGSEKT